MSPSKDVSNTHTPYVYLVAILFLLLRGALDEYAKTALENARCRGALQWLSGRNIPRTSISRRSVHPHKLLQVHSCFFFFILNALNPWIAPRCGD